LMDFLSPHIHSNTALCFPHLMLGTSESDYKVALMMIQNKNSCTLKELKSSMRSCEVEELETHEMVDDGFSISGNDIGDDDFSFSEDAISPCALNYEEDGRSHLTRLDKQTKSFLSPQTQRLHRELDKNSAERICVPTMASLNQSRKNMLGHIDYVKTYCDVENNPRIARIWASMERCLETFHDEARDILAEETINDEEQMHGRILMSGIKMKKKPPETRLKGVSG
jgi:hypothetical protein